MDYVIRRAKREDCEEIMELIRELAVYERAPNEVTVTLEHFEESGFGERPVWWAFVACAPTGVSEQAMATHKQEIQMAEEASLAVAGPDVRESVAGKESIIGAQETIASLPVEPMTELEKPVTTQMPEAVEEALPLMQPGRRCEKVIGFALYYLRYSTWKGQRMYLEDILVTEKWRGKGVGTSLMDSLIAVAKADGLHGISWQVLNWNESAIKFYERYNARFEPDWVNAAVDV